MKTIPFLYVDENILFYKEIEEARCVTAFLYSCKYIESLYFFWDRHYYEIRIYTHINSKDGNNIGRQNTTCYYHPYIMCCW